MVSIKIAYSDKNNITIIGICKCTQIASKWMNPCVIADKSNLSYNNTEKCSMEEMI
jgi:hypothetical protein